MKIITLNANGIRTSASKGLFEWMLRERPDVMCLQETKAQKHQLSAEIQNPHGYFSYFHDAVKMGYSGVAIYCKREPERVKMGLGWPDIDMEGRFLQVDFGRLSVISLYLPSGSSSPERLAVKYDFMGRFMPVLKKLRRSRREYIICGDWNIAHKTIDLKNWRGNQKNSGFLPEERAWLDVVLGAPGWVDAFRVVNPEPDQYTWWSNRGRAWEKNVGWRIDYQIISPRLKEAVKSASIYKERRFSDHAPLTVTYNYDM